ncbi:MAG: serine/threonine protein kinase [bacterium]|nr:serine/threonine protein kinase [bacterium]
MQLPTRYEIVGHEESGGFGKVVQVTDKWLDRDIAVKCLDPVMALRDAERKRFHQEAKILAKMSHPAIPSIYDVIFEMAKDSVDGIDRFQIIFEYIHGQDLHRHLQSEGPASLDYARTWFLQLASALHHAHELGVVHRDVKPQNIIIREDGESCCLVDFGIALSGDQAERATGTGYIVGTQGYMSPEQMTGEELDGRTDIYSLGVCLYEALAGVPVPQGGYEPLSSINEVIPPAIDEIVQDCLKPREERIPDAVTFAQRLANALRVKIPLAMVLSEGRLSDLDAALTQMTPIEFSERPAGQRELIIDKVMGIAETEKPQLEYPVKNLLRRLLYLGTRLDTDQYLEIFELALRWGFDRTYSNGVVGDVGLRRAIARELAQLPQSNHKMVASTILDYCSDRDLESIDAWRLNGLREVVSNVMANRFCEEEDLAGRLGKLLRAIRTTLRTRKTGEGVPTDG